LSSVDCFLFVDGGRNSAADEYIRAVHGPGFEVHARPSQFGCGRNLIGAREYLFEECKYDRVIILEDDVVVSSNYIQFMSNLADFGDRYPSVGVVAGFSPILLTEAEKIENAGNVFLGDSNWISYLMYRRTWESISDDMKEYRSRFLPGDYHNRPNAAIRRWVSDGLKTVCPLSVETIPKGVLDFWNRQTYKFYHETGATGQDGTTCAMLVKHGLAKLATQVNRCSHIGLFGQHSRPHNASTQHLMKQRVDSLPDDSTLREFTWWQHP